jgi:hypothetical protein
MDPTHAVEVTIEAIGRIPSSVQDITSLERAFSRP